MKRRTSIPDDVKEELEKIVASTIIRLTKDDQQRLGKFFKSLNLDLIPSDIIESNTVPIANLAIEFDQRESITDKHSTVRFDVFVLDRERFSNDDAVVISSYSDDMKYRQCILLSVVNGTITSQFMDLEDQKNQEVLITIYRVLLLWYCIQVMLLNPALKEVFRRSGIMSDKDREESKDYKKRPLYYQKVKTINQREFDEVVKRNIVRKTLIWYVIGHWRTYKDGRRIFIQPYWKGALRETRATDTPRERVI